MSSELSFGFDDGAFDREALATAHALQESLGRTMCIAAVLVEHGRTIDLTGLDRGVGLLCAKALDLPPGLGRAFRPQLELLLAEAERLMAIMERHQPA